METDSKSDCVGNATSEGKTRTESRSTAIARPHPNRRETVPDPEHDPGSANIRLMASV